MTTGNLDHSSSSESFDIVFAGDLVLDVPEPDQWLSGISRLIDSADLAVGHLEVPHTNRGTELRGDVPAPGADPAALAALARCGFDALSLAGNHMADCGAEGIEDTLAGLAAANIAACGAGRDLAQARKPALLTLQQHTIALLSYNCVGPEAGWAGDGQAGCAYLPLATKGNVPVTPLAQIETLTEEALEILRSDIAAVQAQAALVIVALHKGIVHTPATLAAYERPVAQAAIDAGADIVVGHHAHIIKGVEIYRGKPIFHGLGNGCVVTRALSPDQAHPDRAAWARRRKKLFGFEPDPAYDLAPFHPEAVNAMLARVCWTPGAALQAGVMPVYVEAPGRPVVADAHQAGEIAEYLAGITSRAGLPPITLKQDANMWAIH